jgi:hypothetical protein
MEGSSGSSGSRWSSWHPILGGCPARNLSSFSCKWLVPTRGIALVVGSMKHIALLQVKT